MRERGLEAHAESAGTDPAERVNPRVAQVLSEIGIDISESKPSRLTDDMVARSGEVTTMGCAMDSGQCPSIRLEKVVDWQLQDPSWWTSTTSGKCVRRYARRWSRYWTTSILNRNKGKIHMNNWMSALAHHYEKTRERYPGEKLLIMFDIDGTIIDTRYMILHGLGPCGWSRGSITADVNFPNWQDYGRGSGENGSTYEYSMRRIRQSA